MNYSCIFHGLLIFVCAYLVVFLTNLWRHGKVYDARRFSRHGDASFCGIQTLSIDFPYKERVLGLMRKYPGNSVDFGKYRRGKTYDSEFVSRHLPEVVRFAKDLASPLSELVGTRLCMTPASHPTTISIIHYNPNGEGIHWHYDSNHYHGRFFTLIVPVEVIGTGRFEYVDGESEVRRVQDQRLSVFFEGDDVFHRGSPNFGGTRTILSVQYVSGDGSQTAVGAVRRWIKDRAFVLF